jgi:hypothetical protein
MLVSFVARALSNVPGNIFCYNAISSSGVILILPGFTIRMLFASPPLRSLSQSTLVTSALELMSKNLFCGSVRMVYAIIYTLFLGFSLTIGSDLYLLFDNKARHKFYQSSMRLNMTYLHGTFVMRNSSVAPIDIHGSLSVGNNNLATNAAQHIMQGLSVIFSPSCSVLNLARLYSLSGLALVEAAFPMVVLLLLGPYLLVLLLSFQPSVDSQLPNHRYGLLFVLRMGCQSRHEYYTSEAR